MPGITTATTTSTLVTGTDADGHVLPLYHRPAEGSDPLVSFSPDGTRAVVSYLVDDDDSRYSSIREFLTDEHFGGEDPDGNWIEFSDGQERNQWIEDNLRTCAECDYDEDDHGSDDEVIEACDEFRPRVVWTERMFWVERYEHGLSCYGLTGESFQFDRQWDVAGGVAILTIPDDWGGEPAEAARAVLASLTSWVNGEVYGIVHETFGPADHAPGGASEDDEACWGYIGAEYAEATLKDEHAHWAGEPS